MRHSGRKGGREGGRCCTCLMRSTCFLSPSKHPCVCMYIYIYIYMCVCVGGCGWVGGCGCGCGCVRKCMYACMHVFVVLSV